MRFEIHTLLHLASFAGVAIFLMLVGRKLNTYLNTKTKHISDSHDDYQKAIQNILDKIQEYSKNLDYIRQKTGDDINSAIRRTQLALDQEVAKLEEYKSQRMVEISNLTENFKQSEMKKIERNALDDGIDSVSIETANQDISPKRKS